jgi:hypothetical protein
MTTSDAEALAFLRKKGIGEAQARLIIEVAKEELDVQS